MWGSAPSSPRSSCSSTAEPVARPSPLCCRVSAAVCRALPSSSVRGELGVRHNCRSVFAAGARDQAVCRCGRDCRVSRLWRVDTNRRARLGELELIRLLGDDESPAVDAGGQVSDDEVTVRLHINFEPKAEGGYVGFDLISGSKYHECFGPRDWGGGGSGDRSPKPSAPPSPDATFSERKPPQ